MRGSLVEGEAVDKYEEMDTDLYRVRSEVYDARAWHSAPKEEKDFKEKVWTQCITFVLVELARSKKAKAIWIFRLSKLAPLNVDNVGDWKRPKSSFLRLASS